MLSYATIGSNNLDKSVPFFTELLGTQGVTKMFDHPRGGVAFGKDGQMVLGVLTPFDRKPATVGNGTMIALAMPSKEKVHEVYDLALKLGGTDEGPAGPRGDTFYAGYFRDLDGNKLCAFWTPQN